MNVFRQIVPSDRFTRRHASYMHFFTRVLQHVAAGNVLEIGCRGGGGILSYAEYFGGRMGQNRRFISVDIEARPAALDRSPAVEHIQADAYMPQTVQKLAAAMPFAVIIDDGPHTVESQQFFAEHYSKLLGSGGIAIIEDVQKAEYVQQIHTKVPAGFVCYAVDLRLADSRYDSLLVVIEPK